MRGYLLGILVLLKHCFCGDVVNFDGDIKDFVVGKSKLFVLTDHQLHQMRLDLSEEKRKDITNTDQNRVNILVPFDDNDTLITCGTFTNGYCEVLDLNDITKSIYYESGIPIGPKQNEKSVAFIAGPSTGRYLLVGKKDDDEKKDDGKKDDDEKAPYPVVILWNTLQSQYGGIFSDIEYSITPSIQSTARDVEFVDGFQRVSPSESYLFLNAKTDSESKVHVLWMNSSKRKKTEIFRSLQAATIQCCNDKARPVLVASTVIPSVNGVIWAGVFSAQNQQDPENTALALYDISTVKGRVKGFCTVGELPCGSESVSALQPLSVVFKYSSMSSVAAVRNGSWIVMFIGTSDGQLIKLILDEKFTPGCSTVLYKSDDEREVLPRMHFDPVDFKHIYIALNKQLRRVSVVQCVKFSTLKDCRAALDPLCGWCVDAQRCSTQDECPNTSWVSIPKNSLQTQLLSFQMIENSSRKITLHLASSLESTGNPIFSCSFTTGSVNLCDGSDLTAVFPNCSCSFSDQLLYTGGLTVSATVTIEDQKITETLTLRNCSSITDNSPIASYTQCVQCISSGCQWSSSSQRCDWTHGPGLQLHIQKPNDACKDVLSQSVYKEPEIFSLEPNKVSFHGRNNVLLRGKNLESVTKIRIQGDLDCIPKESPVFDRSSDTLRFHIPPSGSKGTVKVCVVTPDDSCHGNSIITYSSQPSCTGIQPTVSWRRGGRKIHVQGSNMEFVESVTFDNYDQRLQTQYNPRSGDVWFHSPHNYGHRIGFKLNFGNSTVDCEHLSYESNPIFTAFTTIQVASDLQVNIKSGSALQPLSVVFKYSSMSSVAAVRNGSWIVMFIGTSDGQLIKLMLDEKFTPGCPIVLYKSDDERAVLPRMHFDPVDFKHIYTALRKQLRRVSVVQCVKYSSLKDCRAALDPLCGWCVKTQRCSTQDECSESSWMSTPKDSLQEPLVSFQAWADESSRKITLHLALSLESTGNPVFSCSFTTGSVNLCDGSDLTAVFPNCHCSFSDQLLHTGDLKVSAIVAVEDQKITETLTLRNCLNITDNSPNPSYTQCVQCISSGCQWSSSSLRCDWTHGPGPQLHIQDSCKDLLSEMDYTEPEILSLEPNKVSFHGRNNVLLRGKNLESVTKIRIQGDLDCIPKESPVFNRSSDTLRFHIPPSGSKGTVKVCVVTPDDSCHGNNIITYSSQPSCTGIQPTVSWRRGGRKIHVQGINMEFVESVIFDNYDQRLQTQYNPRSGDVWFHSPDYYKIGSGSFKLNVGNSTVDCEHLSYEYDPEFIAFTTVQVASDLQVNIQKKADLLNLSMSEVNVTGYQGDQQYQCVLEKIESNAIICRIEGESGAVTAVDMLNISSV
ncbi:plexin-C1-like isoform X2 [Ctenopharyngodon idella]|uniref:plexin-C1-like isoform X2 n=1 Tax=Ctenopharyngodon idella TaxID=7959 RepID=UPI0022316CE5|nr:plexin-C1-like isoform X2 [Ctenopharyngodon idella]